MSGPEHLRRVREGVFEWNRWREREPEVRPHLRGADLAYGRLRGINLSGADLRDARLADADLTAAALDGADLRRSLLRWTVLRASSLRRANLRSARLHETLLLDADLEEAEGLAHCLHLGPSTIDFETVHRSGCLPRAFLVGCGLQDWQIEAMGLACEGIGPERIEDVARKLGELRCRGFLLYHSCFLSHASEDRVFVSRLHSRLQKEGVRCWLAESQLGVGAATRDTICAEVRSREKLLVVMSRASIASQWVDHEVELALERERRTGERVVIAIRIDEVVATTEKGWATFLRTARNIGDFTNWRKDDAFEASLVKLLADLSAERFSASAR